MTSLRERTRLAVRDEVLSQAWTLFAEQGFEGTTVEQVAEAAGMSRRTFFRYFTGKEELVLARLLEADARTTAAMAERPSAESAWAALHSTLASTVTEQERHADTARALLAMLREPGLRATVQERQYRWVQALKPLIAERLDPVSAPDPRPAAIAAAALSCMNISEQLWVDHPASSRQDLLDQAMHAVSPLR